MKNQVLSIEQMQKLKELGVDTSKASMAVYNIYAGEQKEYGILASNGAFAEKQEHDRFGYGIHNVVSFDKKPVFTLQDIIAILPMSLDYDGFESYLVIERWKEEYFFAYNCINGKLKEIKSSDILNAAYEMLIWAAKYGHLKTK